MLCAAKDCKVQVPAGSWLCLPHWAAVLPCLRAFLEQNWDSEQIDFAYIKAQLFKAYLDSPAAIIAFFRKGSNEAVRELESVRLKVCDLPGPRAPSE